MPALAKERLMTTVADVMTRGVRSMSPNDTVVLAAQARAELNVGVSPVCDGEKLVGMVTDRDIDVRGATQDEDIDDVLHQMADSQIRRMPVVDGQQRLVGIISLGDIASKNPQDEEDVGLSLGDISTPSAPDRSGQAKAGGSATGKPRRQPR